MNKKYLALMTSFAVAVCILIGVLINYRQTGEVDENKVGQALNTIVEGIETYNLSDKEVKELPSTEIVEQTEKQEKETGEQQATLETEGFEEQGDIAFNGTKEFPKVKLGNYTGLTYYSQIDSRWKKHLYTSTGNKSQNIGSSGCGPTTSAMVVTAIKGTIKPNEMGDLFVKYGYRSANNGTYYSAFRFVADTFNIKEEETTSLNKVVELLNNKHLVIASCGNGLFTTGGHYILITAIDGNTLKIYDPYLYSGKFDTFTRRGKVTVKGNTVYCSVNNFKKYANGLKFFAFKQETKAKTNNKKKVKTSSYTRYVKVKTVLNVRQSNTKKSKIVGTLKNNKKVTVTKTKGNWSYITSPKKGWVSSKYLINKK